ncbi:unnamed protein product, partial [marine sediment metagenome]
GHSGGEIAAAYASEVLSVEDAAMVAWGHVCIIKYLTGTGTMAHISLSSGELKRFLVDQPTVTIAARNSPFATVLVGQEEPLRSIVEKVEADTDVFCRMLRVDVPLHSPSVEPYLDSIRSVISGIYPNPPRIPIYSTLYGRLAQDGDFDTTYWCNHIRQPVEFMEAVTSALSDGVESFLELTPHAVLQDAMIDCSRAFGKTVFSCALMHRDEDAAPVISEALSMLQSHNDNITSRAVNEVLSDDAKRILDTDPARRMPLIIELVGDCLREASGME